MLDSRDEGMAERDRACVELDMDDLGEPGNLARGILRMAVPPGKGNAPLYAAIERWWLKIDRRTGRVVQEIGLDADGRPRVAAPFGGNSGVWANVPWAMDANKFRRVPETEFDRQWNEMIAAQPPERVSEPVLRRVAKADDLYGLWSTALPGLSGAMSDEAIAFFPDRRGFLAAYNGELMLYETFVWSWTEQDGLSFESSTLYEKYGAHRVGCPGGLSKIRGRVISVETSGDSVRALVLDLREAGYEWVDECFARRPRSLDEIEWPTFEARGRQRSDDT